MRYFVTTALLIVVSIISACGGGGGSAGTTIGQPVNPPSTQVATRLSVALQDSSGINISSIPVSGGGQLVVLLTDNLGAPIAGQLVNASELGSSLSVFPNGDSGLTDASGVAKIKVNRKTSTKFGQGTFSVKFDAPTCPNAVTNSCFLSSSTTSDFRAGQPIIKLELLDSLGGPTTSVSTLGFSTLKATIKFEDGTPVVQKRVDVSSDPVKVSFPEGFGSLTSDAGVALIKIARASQNANGAGTVLASATISGTNLDGGTDTTVITSSLDYNLGVAVGAEKLLLSNLDVGSVSLSAYGTRQISVQVKLGTLPPTNPVTVTFAASCGQILPVSAPTNASGIASVSFTATDAAGTTPSTLGCSGKNVEISASAVGADSVIRKAISILSAPATNLSFVVPLDQTKLRIYLDGAGGNTQTLVQFLLTNAVGEAIPSQEVLVALKTLNGGIPRATFGTKGNVSAISLITDASGKISVPVFSGTVPTNVLINAALVSNPAVQTDSSIVTVASGRPSQARVSLSLGKLSILGFNLDGEETTVMMSLADRQGNPVPDGTAVNFVTEGGVMIPPICTTGGSPGDSRCTVKIRTQNPRPTDGRVSILAYAAGEEDFVDINFNNVYDCGEPFTDLGTAFRNDGAVTAGVPSGSAYVQGAFAVPRSGAVSACSVSTTPTPTAGDGVWGAADVRQQAVLIFATDAVKVGTPVWSTSPASQWGGATVTNQVVFNVSDLNNNSVPTGSGLAVLVTDNSPKLPTDGTAVGVCTLTSVSNDKVPNSLDPLSLVVSLKDCVAGDLVKVTVTTPSVVSNFSFTVP